MTVLEELLEKKDIITDIAVELYGPMYVFDRRFWGSPTESDLNEVQQQLINLGHVFEPTPEEQELADIIYKALLEQEIISYKKKGPQRSSDDQENPNS
jgi:hypothetical protein